VQLASMGIGLAFRCKGKLIFIVIFSSLEWQLASKFSLVVESLARVKMPSRRSKLTSHEVCVLLLPICIHTLQFIYFLTYFSLILCNLLVIAIVDVVQLVLAIARNRCILQSSNTTTKSNTSNHTN